MTSDRMQLTCCKLARCGESEQMNWDFEQFTLGFCITLWDARLKYSCACTKAPPALNFVYSASSLHPMRRSVMLPLNKRWASTAQRLLRYVKSQVHCSKPNKKARTHARTHTHSHTHTQTHTCTHTPNHTLYLSHTHTNIHTYIHTQTHKHTSARTHTQLYVWKCTYTIHPQWTWQHLQGTSSVKKQGCWREEGTRQHQIQSSKNSSKDSSKDRSSSQDSSVSGHWWLILVDRVAPRSGMAQVCVCVCVCVCACVHVRVSMCVCVS